MKLLFFKASWCTGCHAIEKTVPSYAEHIDCEETPEIPDKYNVCGLPVFIAVDDNDKEVARLATTNVRIVDRWFKDLIGVKDVTTNKKL